MMADILETAFHWIDFKDAGHLGRNLTSLSGVMTSLPRFQALTEFTYGIRRLRVQFHQVSYW